MTKRRKSAKHVHVQRYARWIRGKRKRVGEHHRGDDHPLAVRKSAKQLRLDLDPDEKPPKP